MDALFDAIANQVIKGLPIGQLALQIVGGLVVLGFFYIKATPTQDDDAFLQKLENNAWTGALLRVLVRLSPIERVAPKDGETPK